MYFEWISEQRLFSHTVPTSRFSQQRQSVFTAQYDLALSINFKLIFPFKALISEELRKASQKKKKPLTRNKVIFH